MPKFSTRSKERLTTCHPDIQKVFNEVIKHVDCTILEGIRTADTQAEYVRTGKSRTMNSKHLEQNDGYSHAVDVAPWPIDWSDKDRFTHFAGIVRGVALSMGITLRWGGDWDMDLSTKDHSFYDGPHYELVK